MIKLFLCLMAVTIGHISAVSYNSPCGSIPFRHPYPRDPHNSPNRVGVVPARLVGATSSESEESREEGEKSVPTPAPCETTKNLLPVSICIQLPPNTPLTMSKSVLQQIIYSLTDKTNTIDPLIEEIPSIPSHPAVLSPQPVQNPTPSVSSPQQPVYGTDVPQPRVCPLQRPYPEPSANIYPIRTAASAYPTDVSRYDEPPRPAPVPEPVSQPPRYPSNDLAIGQPAFMPPSQPAPSAYCFGGHCGLSLQPRYNQ
ncbi:uncharacterized protein LOC129725293 [Wyeomyia smithii]|uniref:uncharacterized protein LOC129725293 n=1 Tax=Wyeomyia smithii TaxID=174621 RepID=UPI002467EBAB|nr:uncharacterized protein LOC129725293 [Wyeomyia smithii]